MSERIVSIPLTFITRTTCYLRGILSILPPSLHTQNLSYHLNGEAPRLNDGQLNQAKLCLILLTSDQQLTILYIGKHFPLLLSLPLYLAEYTTN